MELWFDHLSSYEKLKTIHEIAEFNNKLAIMLNTESGICGKDPRLDNILTLRKEHAMNKEVIRYHAIYII